MYWTARLGDHVEAPLAQRTYWWWRGFRVSSVRQYAFPRPDMHEYVNDYSENYGSLHLNPIPLMFRHKAMQRAFLQTAGAAQPEVMAALWRGRVVLHPFSPRAAPVTVAELEQALRADGGEFILKPEEGGGGDKVALIRAEHGTLVRHYGRDSGPLDLQQCHDRAMLIERRAEQAGFWRDLFPGSLNTMRLLTLWREGDRAPIIARVAQRIGTLDSTPTDNHGRGGLALPIDRETGRLGHGSRKDYPEERLTNHPDTGTRFEGLMLPAWEAIRTEVLRLAGSLPLNCFVGWDVFVNAEGKVAICEANGARTGVLIMQLERGLLADPETRRYYEESGWA